MLPVFRVGRCPGVDRQKLRERLLVAPWLWPRATSGEPYAFAANLTDCDSPPDPVPGRCILVSVHRAGDSVWLFGGEDLEPLADTDRADLSLTAQAAFATAAAAASRCLDVLWEPIAALQRRRFVAFRLGTHARDTVDHDPELIDGESFGVSFLLVIVSQLFRLSVPRELAASAKLLESGDVDGVRDLPRKIAALLDVTPQVSRILVPRHQFGEAVKAARSRLEVVPVGTGREAIAAAFGNGPLDVLRIAAEDAEGAAAIAGRLFALTTKGRAAVHDWAPVERASSLLLDMAGSRLDPKGRYDVELAGAIAARHRNNSGLVALPSPEWLAAQPAPAQDGIIAALIQHAADTTIFDPVELERLGRARLPVSIRDGNEQQLKVAGALGRLLAVTGRAREALALQRAAAEAFCRAPNQGNNVSYSLSEWFRLSGLCNEPDSFEKAEQMRSDLLNRGELSEAGSQYVALSRARAMFWLGTPVDACRHRLEALWRQPGLHDGVRWSTLRWLVRACDRLGDGRHVEPCIVQARAVATENDAAGRALVLMDLDRALAASDASSARSALERLQMRQPGIVGHLIRAAGNDDIPAYVARFFPY